MRVLSDQYPGSAVSRAQDASVAQGLSVAELINAVEMRKVSLGAGAAADLYGAWVDHNVDHPLRYAVLFNYAVLLTDAGALDQARARLEQAIIANPDFTPAYINLGRVYERMGSTGLATLQWSNAVDRLAAVSGPAISHKTTALNQLARVFESTSDDAAAPDRHVWVADGSWMNGGSYLVARRIRMFVESWDRDRLGDQNAVFGRDKATGAR